MVNQATFFPSNYTNRVVHLLTALLQGGACVDSVCGGTFLEERCPRPQFFSKNSNFSSLWFK